MERIPLVVDCLDTGEELGIEEDRILMRRQLRRFFCLYFLQRLVRVRLRQGEEDLRRTRQQCAALLHRHDRVVERRRIGIVRDRFDFRDLLLHPFLDRRLVVRVLDLIERRRLERQRAGRGEGIGLCECGGGNKAEGGSQSFHNGLRNHGKSRA